MVLSTSFPSDVQHDPMPGRCLASGPRRRFVTTRFNRASQCRAGIATSPLSVFSLFEHLQLCAFSECWFRDGQVAFMARQISMAEQNWERPKRQAPLHVPKSPIGPDLSIRPRSLVVLRLFHAQRSVQAGQQLGPFVGAQLGKVLKFPAYCGQILCCGQIQECPVRLAAFH